MKIALLGAPSSGKTVYLTALYHRFRHETGLPHLSVAQRKQYKSNGIDKKVGFRVQIDDCDLEAELSAGATLLMKHPIQWPDKTESLNNRTIEVQFDFLPISKKGKASTYERSIELCDPTGGAFRGEHSESSDILEELKMCDIGVVFLSAKVIMEAIDPDTEDVDEDRLAEIRGGFLLGQTTQLLKKMNRTILGDDIFPVCFVVSMFDLVPPEKIKLINSIIIERIIRGFSEDNKRFMVCVCPISVKHPKTGNFHGVNLEWPFLFAAGGTIFRNSLELRKEAEADESRAREAEENANRLENLYNSSKLDYFFNWAFSFGKESYVIEQGNSRSCYNSAGRLIEESDDDKSLAVDIWSSIATEGPSRGVRVFMAGKKVNIKRWRR